MTPLSKKQPDGYKAGPNKLDQNKITEMAKDGVSAEEISCRLKIKLESVKGWMPKKKKKKTTLKAKEEA